MGIPHLITCLRPFATTVDLAGHMVVIDGPGLAYHVWHIYLASQPQFLNPFEIMPSYRLIGDTVLGWLDELQAHNVCLKKIFFDGFLPSSKRDIRSGRLSGYTKQLSDYHQAWPQIIPSMHTSSTCHKSPTNLFNTQAISSSVTKLPAAPFLVPAIIESLSISDRYQNVIEVVPGEADQYCAHYIKVHGGTVLTGDSDLLVHDLDSGAVIFLRDVELVELGNATSLRCLQYNVGAITERLGLPKTHGLLALAFEMSMNTHGGFPDLLQQAAKLKAVSLHKSEYLDFAAQYAPPPHDLEMRTSNDNNDRHGPSTLSRRLQVLDPRISEYALQFSTFSRAACLPDHLLPSPIDGQRIIDVFLPFLLDCPLRTSAWEMSTPVRQLAYGLVNLVIPIEERITTVVEYRRLQNGTRGREWKVPTNQDIPKACADLTILFKEVRNGMSAPTDEDLWRAVAVYQDQALASRSGKPALSSSFMHHSKGGNASPFRLTWDGIHFSAQLQGSYYSFRILSLVLGLVLSCEEAKTLPSALYELQSDLESLPAIGGLPRVFDSIRNLGSLGDQAILDMVRKLLNLQDESMVAMKCSVNNKKKNRKINRAQNETKSQQKRQNNIFEVLNTE